MQPEFFYEMMLGQTGLDVTPTIMRSLQSFSIVQEDGKLTKCNISLKAGHSSLLDKMVEGVQCAIKIGYREGISARAYFFRLRPFNPALDRLIFRGEFGRPTIMLGANGLKTFSFTLHSKEVEMAMVRKFKRWRNVPRALVVSQIGYTYTDIRSITTLFSTAGQVLTGRGEVQNNETDFAFLNRMCVKWGTTFKLEYNPLTFGFDMMMLNKDMSNPQMPVPYPLHWGEQTKSLKSLKFNPPQSRANGGVTITPVRRGRTRTYTASVTQPDGTVVNYRLNEALIRRDMRRGDSAAVLSTILSTTNFSDPAIRRYWTQTTNRVNTRRSADEQASGQSGSGGGRRGKNGMKASIELAHGDPFFTNAIECNLEGENVPSRIQGIWKVSKATHNIATGYSTVAEIYK